jgi:RHS repeat-associated protein
LHRGGIAQQTQLNPPDAVGYGGQLTNYTDVEANLVLMTYRFYSPVYCRFLTRDPSGYEGGINLYAYCRNNPINRFDPLGLDERSSNNPWWP